MLWAPLDKVSICIFLTPDNQDDEMPELEGGAAKEEEKPEN
jgi:hypothetical protein